MTVILNAPRLGLRAGDLYTGSDEASLLALGLAKPTSGTIADYGPSLEPPELSPALASLGVSTGQDQLLAALAALGIQPQPTLPYKIVLPRGRTAVQASAVGTSVQRENRKWMPFLSVVPVGRIWFMFANSYFANASGGELPGPAGIQYQVGFEIALSGGTQTKAVKFPAASSGLQPSAFGGLGASTTGDATSYTPAPGEIFYGYVDLADYGIAAWQANVNAWVRTTETYASGAALIGIYDPATGGTAQEDSWVFNAAQAAQYLGTGTLNSTGNASRGYFSYQPVAVLGTWGVGNAGLKSLLTIGDSIADGSTLTKDSGVNVNGTAGAVAGVFGGIGGGAGSGSFIDIAARNAGVPYVKATRGSDGYTSIETGLRWKTRNVLMRFATDMIDEFGLNSASSGSAVNLAYAKTQIAQARFAGVKRVAHLLNTNSCASTDNFKTPQNMSVATGTDQVLAFNAALQALTPGLGGPDAILDTRSPVFDPLYPNFWKTDGVTANLYTIEGTHPQQAAQPLMVTPIQNWLQTA